ncbi:MAG: NIPSNAP family protein [Anaerolineales bacterium]
MKTKTYSPIVELRMYTLRKNRRDELIELFEREFIESREAVGIQVLGQFRDIDNPKGFVWLQGFNDMSARAQSLNAFYTSPIWMANRDAANATIIDSGNVLLLHPIHPTAGFDLHPGKRPPQGNTNPQNGFVAVNIYYFSKPVSSDFINFFENTIQPALITTGAYPLASFVTEDSPNTYPRLPIREGEHVFVYFSGFRDEEAYQSHLVESEDSKIWKNEISSFLKKHLKGKPEILRLTPTPRSWLTGIS